MQRVLVGDRAEYDARWLQTARDILGGSFILVEYQIVSEVSANGWRIFQDLVGDDSREWVRSFPPARKIIKIIDRAVQHMRRDRFRPAPPLMSDATGDVASHAAFSFSTHNIEKFGQRTKHREDKAYQELGLWDTFVPDIGSMQEVTRPDLFADEIEQAREATGQFGFLHGPKYESGTYSESYSAAFNRGTVHFPPELKYIDPASGEVRPYSAPLSFGKQAATEEGGDPTLKRARPTSFYDLYLPAGRNLRPAFKTTGDEGDSEEYVRTHANLLHRMYRQYVRLRYMNVHTSPGKSTPTINNQVSGILDELRSQAEDEPNTVAVGDFYAQKGAKRKWAELEREEGGFKLAQPGVPTNFKKGKGIQVADHAVVPTSFSGVGAWAVPPIGTSDESPEDLDESAEDLMRRGKNESELAKWEDFGVDHAFVFGRADVPVGETVSNLVLYLQQIFNDIYRQNNCLIHAVADAANRHVNDAELTNIRNLLYAQRGIPPGSFIEANGGNLGVILGALNLYGRVQIENVDNPDHAALPVTVEKKKDNDVDVDLTIKYSRSHFFAKPA